jgi:hypothetical protein
MTFKFSGTPETQLWVNEENQLVISQQQMGCDQSVFFDLGMIDKLVDRIQRLKVEMVEGEEALEEELR